MAEIKWRFPGNNYTTDNGLDTADMAKTLSMLREPASKDL